MIFTKTSTDTDTFKKEIYSKIEKSLEDVRCGRFRSIKDFNLEMEEFFNNNE